MVRVPGVCRQAATSGISKASWDNCPGGRRVAAEVVAGQCVSPLTCRDPRGVVFPGVMYSADTVLRDRSHHAWQGGRMARAIKMVGRREFIAILASAATSRAMAQTRVPRPLVAVLEGTSSEVAPYYLRPFEQTLRQHGHVNGQTIDFVHKFADGDASRYPALAEELIRLTPAVLVTGSTTGALACKRLTATIPIVSANLTDPIGLGLISTLARPGGNVTGVVISLEGLPGKLLQILSEVVPEARRIGLLANPSERANARQRQAAEQVAAGLGMTFITVPVRTRDDIASAFEEFLRARVEAIYAPSSLMLRAERQYFAERALAARLPTMCN